jgi:hypothetical protein
VPPRTTTEVYPQFLSSNSTSRSSAAGAILRQSDHDKRRQPLPLLPSFPRREALLLTADVIPGTARLRGAKLIAGAVGLYLVLRVLGFHKLFENDAEGIGALLQIIGTLYSVVYAFAIYVIWGQFTSVENEIQKESGALKDLLLFSQRLKETIREPIVRAVKTYARAVAETEWSALAAGEGTDQTDKLFSAVISSVTDVKPEDDTERIVYQRLLEIANLASAHRDERLALSVKRMPQTLLLFVTLTASMILFLLLFFPFRNIVLGLVAIAITAMLLCFAHFVLTDLDNPFEGTWNVGSEPFAELVTKLR